MRHQIVENRFRMRWWPDSDQCSMWMVHTRIYKMDWCISGDNGDVLTEHHPFLTICISNCMPTTYYTHKHAPRRQTNAICSSNGLIFSRHTCNYMYIFNSVNFVVYLFFPCAVCSYGTHDNGGHREKNDNLYQNQFNILIACECWWWSWWLWLLLLGFIFSIQ